MVSNEAYCGLLLLESFRATIRGSHFIISLVGFAYGSRSTKRLRKYHVSAAWQGTMLWRLTSTVAIPSLTRL